MRLAFGSLIVLVVALGAFSAPLPQVSPPPAPPAAPAPPPAPPAAPASPPATVPAAPPVSPAAAAPAQAPSQLDVTSPIKFSDLNGPSQGVAFNDFAALPIQKGSSVAAPVKGHVRGGEAAN